MLSSTVRPGKSRDFWYVRARPSFGRHARRQVGDVLPHQLDRARRGREVAGDDVEQRRLAGAVRPEDRAALAVRDVEVDVAHGLHTAEAPADPPQAEDRLGASAAVLSVTAYLMTWFVITPFLTTLILPCHGMRLLHARRLRAARRRARLLEQPAERLVDVRDVADDAVPTSCRPRSGRSAAGTGPGSPAGSQSSLTMPPSRHLVAGLAASSAAPPAASRRDCRPTA